MLNCWEFPSNCFHLLCELWSSQFQQKSSVESEDTGGRRTIGFVTEERKWQDINISAENVLGFPEGVKGPLEIWVTYVRWQLSAQLGNFCSAQWHKSRYDGAALPGASGEGEWRRRGGCSQEAFRVRLWSPSLGKKMRQTFAKWCSLDNWSQWNRNVWNWSIFNKQARGQHVIQRMECLNSGFQRPFFPLASQNS